MEIRFFIGASLFNELDPVRRGQDDFCITLIVNERTRDNQRSTHVRPWPSALTASVEPIFSVGAVYDRAFPAINEIPAVLRLMNEVIIARASTPSKAVVTAKFVAGFFAVMVAPTTTATGGIAVPAIVPRRPCAEVVKVESEQQHKCGRTK